MWDMLAPNTDLKPMGSLHTHTHSSAGRIKAQPWFSVGQMRCWRWICTTDWIIFFLPPLILWEFSSVLNNSTRNPHLHLHLISPTLLTHFFRTFTNKHSHIWSTRSTWKPQCVRSSLFKGTIWQEIVQKMSTKHQPCKMRSINWDMFGIQFTFFNLELELRG